MNVLMMNGGMMGDRMMGDGMMAGQMWLWMLAALVLFLAVIALVTVVTVWVARKAALASTPAQGDGNNARRIVDARYARGELSRDDYLQARRDLNE